MMTVQKGVRPVGGCEKGGKEITLGRKGKNRAPQRQLRPSTVSFDHADWSERQQKKMYLAKEAIDQFLLSCLSSVLCAPVWYQPWLPVYLPLVMAMTSTKEKKKFSSTTVEIGARD